MTPSEALQFLKNSAEEDQGFSTVIVWREDLLQAIRSLESGVGFAESKEYQEVERCLELAEGALKAMEKAGTALDAVERAEKAIEAVERAERAVEAVEPPPQVFIGGHWTIAAWDDNSLSWDEEGKDD